VFLQIARYRVQVAGARVAAGLAPRLERLARCRDCRVDIGFAANRHLGEYLAGRRVLDRPVRRVRGGLPLIVDKQLEVALVTVQPGVREGR
jgi:hypothetical protein